MRQRSSLLTEQVISRVAKYYIHSRSGPTQLETEVGIAEATVGFAIVYSIRYVSLGHKSSLRRNEDL